jgi:hypothetical protein
MGYAPIFLGSSHRQLGALRLRQTVDASHEDVLQRGLRMYGMRGELHPARQNPRDYGISVARRSVPVPPFDPSLLLSLSLPSPRKEARISLFAIPTDVNVKTKTGIVNCNSAVDEREECGEFHAVR